MYALTVCMNDGKFTPFRGVLARSNCGLFDSVEDPSILLNLWSHGMSEIELVKSFSCVFCNLQSLLVEPGM